MRKLLYFPVIVLLASSLVSCAQRQGAASSADPSASAKQFVEQMAKGDFAAATSRFDATMKAAMSAQSLQSAWQTVVAQAGPFKKQAGTRTEKVGGYDVVFVRCEFQNGPLDAQVAFNQAGEISGLYFVQSRDVSEYQEAKVAPPPKPSGVREREVKVGSGDWALPGTLSLPNGSGPFPAVVLVHGSGPNDRDETVFANKPFRDLAHGLASRGVATLRYDKRTLVYSAKMAALKDLTTKEEVTDDAIAAAALLRKTDAIDPKKVFVLGHSLGGMLIPRIGKFDSNLAGLIVLAGTARPLEDVIVQQIRYLSSLDGTVTEEEKKRIEKIGQQAGQVKTLTGSSAPIFGVPAKYWLDLRGYDPPAVAAELKQPILVLQGERDYQVTMDDFQRWKQVLSTKPSVTLKTHPNLNHLFIEGQAKSWPDEYHKAGHVAQKVIDDIANWISRQ